MLVRYARGPAQSSPDAAWEASALDKVVKRLGGEAEKQRVKSATGQRQYKVNQAMSLLEPKWRVEWVARVYATDNSPLYKAHLAAAAGPKKGLDDESSDSDADALPPSSAIKAAGGEAAVVPLSEAETAAAFEAMCAELRALFKHAVDNELSNSVLIAGRIQDARGRYGEGEEF